MSLISRIRASLYERSRSYVCRRQIAELGRHLGIPRDISTDLQSLQTVASLRSYLKDPVDLVVDIGAHKAGFSLPAYFGLQAKELLAFEPNPALIPLLRRSLEKIPATIRNSAVGDAFGQIELNIHADPSMSSVLNADPDILKREFNTYDTQQIQKVVVPVTTLAEELSKQPWAKRRFFLKIDTQGNELSVLRGSVNVLPYCKGILTEYMFLTPYQGQESFEDLVLFLRNQRFFCRAALDIKRRASNLVSGVDFLFLPDCPAS